MKSIKPHFPVLSALIAIMMVCLSTTATLAQQDSTKTFRIQTKDGNEYIGTVIERDASQIRFNARTLGEITLRTTDIVNIEEIESSRIKDDTFWPENLQSTRYLWSPSGYGLKKGEGYYQNIWVLFNHFSVGISDHFSLGGGMIPLFLFAGAPTPAWITPKFSVPIKENRVNLGIGGLFGGVLGERDTGFGVAYGIFTLGTRDQNLSVGLGYGYAAGEWSSYPAISVSGMIRTGSRGYLLTENYFFGGAADFVMLSFAGRRIIKGNGLDFGLLIPSDTGGEILAVPWLGLTIPFGNKARITR